MNLERTSEKLSGDTEAAVIFSARELRASADKGIGNAFRNLCTTGTFKPTVIKLARF